MKTAIVTIGDEILIGQTIDTNSTFIAKQLTELGFSIEEIVTVADEETHILQTLERLFKKVDLILTTGGLGPTKDDITKKTLAKFFNSGFTFHEKVFGGIKNYYEKRGRKVLPEHRELAMLPTKSKLLLNNKGTAAAMWFNENGKQLISMPGVPYEMEDFMLSQIVSLLKEYNNNVVVKHLHVLTAGEGETMIADKIETVVEAFDKNTKIAYLPSLGTVKLRVTTTGTNEKELEEKLTETGKNLKEKIGSSFVSFGQILLEEYLGRLLKEKNATVASAESCTGGMIAHKITSVSGSSAYFKGSVISYANEVKVNQLGVNQSDLDEYGAVSEQVVIQMAKGVLQLLQTDFAVATSGIAGPTGGTKDKPVGTIWVAFASQNKVLSKKYQLTSYRDINIPLTTNSALNDLRRFILSQDV